MTKRPTNVGSLPFAKRAKASGLKSFFKPKSATPPPLPAMGSSSSQSPPLATSHPRPDEAPPADEAPSTGEVRHIVIPDDDIAPVARPDQETSASLDRDPPGTPNHPDPKTIPPKKTATQNINFQGKWFEEYPWLTYDVSIQAVLCYKCEAATRLGIMNLATKSEDAFVSTGFSNWKKAKQRFQSHMTSLSHNHAVNVLRAQQHKSVSIQLCADEEGKQQERRRCLLKIIKWVRYLLRQGLAFRSDPASEGNLFQLLKADAEDVPGLATYLKAHTNYSSWRAQQELARDLCHNILRTLAKKVNIIKSLIMFRLREGSKFS